MDSSPTAGTEDRIDLTLELVHFDEARRRLLRASIDQPGPQTWQRARGVLVDDTTTLEKAVRQLYPDLDRVIAVRRERGGGEGWWPDPALQVAALRRATGTMARHARRAARRQKWPSLRGPGGFYAEGPVRAGSPEVDCGPDWQGPVGRPSPPWRVSWVEYTGEVYAMEHAGEHRVELLGVVWTRAELDGLLDGWAELPRKRLDWARLRLEATLDHLLAAPEATVELYQDVTAALQQQGVDAAVTSETDPAGERAIRVPTPAGSLLWGLVEEEGVWGASVVDQDATVLVGLQVDVADHEAPEGVAAMIARLHGVFGDGPVDAVPAPPAGTRRERAPHSST